MSNIDNIPFWRPYIEKAEQLCKDAGGSLFWKTKYDDLDFTPINVSSEVGDLVWNLETEANMINPKTGEKRNGD